MNLSNIATKTYINYILFPIVQLRIISASEIERYAYCPLNWLRSVKGVNGRGEEITEGVKKHVERGQDIGKVQKKERRDISFTTHMLLTCVAAVSFLFLAVIFFRPYLESGREPWKIATLVLMVLSLLSFIFSLLFFYVAYRNFSSAKKLRIEHSIAEGEIEYLDTDENKPLTSERYMIRGKPDYIIKKDNIYIPVELKTGRVPKGPLFSHILQVGTYCLLLEDKYGIAPPYGILEYQGKKQIEEENENVLDKEINTKVQHKIEYSAELKKTILDTIERIQIAYEKNEAHRNHNRIGRCRHCSRGEGCPERLKE